MGEDRLELRDLKNFSGHSLRAGFCTTAGEKGAEERAIAAQTGHRSLTMLRRYIRDGNVLQNDALEKLGF
jgi:integrase